MITDPKPVDSCQRKGGQALGAGGWPDRPRTPDWGRSTRQSPLRQSVRSDGWVLLPRRSSSTILLRMGRSGQTEIHGVKPRKASPMASRPTV